MHIAHSLAIAWGCFVFLAAVFIIPVLLLRPEGSTFGRLTWTGLNTSAFWLVLGVGLSTLKSLNALMLILLAGLTLVVQMNRSAGIPVRRRIESASELLLSSFRSVEDVSDWLGRQLPTLQSLRRHPWVVQQTLALARLPRSSLAFLFLVCVVIVTTVRMHLTSLQTVRLNHPDEYLALLRTRQLTLSQQVFVRPMLLPAIAAVIASLSSVDPLAIVQGLSFLIPILLTLALGRTVFLLSRSLVASAAAMYCEGVASLAHAAAPSAAVLLGEDNPLTQWMSAAPTSSVEVQTAVFLLLLWITVVLETRLYGTAQGLAAATVACLVVLATSSLLFLLLMPFIGAACLSRRPAMYLGAEIVVLAMAGLVWMTRSPTAMPELQFLPCALSLLVGLLTYSVELVLVAMLGLPARMLVACCWICVAAVWLPPQMAVTQPLEYDAVAQNAMLIAEHFPRHRWIIAAPVEQLPEVYSLGFFQDLATFVDAARNGDLSKALQYGSSYDDLFIFVEKAPFSQFPAEPGTVDFPVLTDSTYRYYRSPAGRASLEARALQLCELYRKSHREMTVFFEDQNVRIYRVHLSEKTGEKPFKEKTGR